MTEPYHADNLVTVHHGDCLQHLRNLPDNSIDSIVTDPPYGLSNTGPGNVADTIVRWAGGERDHVPEGRGFMGRPWDAFVPPPAVWDECLRVLKPGGHMLVFAGSRTQDLMGMSIRLAGFELRDSLAWITGSGFPKSLDVSKAIDKAAGAEGTWTPHPKYANRNGSGEGESTFGQVAGQGGTRHLYTSATPEAERWAGWGTALKPSHEPVLCARKPLTGTVAANVLEWGTGALNIDACRVPSDEITGWGGAGAGGGTWNSENMGLGKDGDARPVQGRWPANVLLDPEAAEEMDAQSGILAVAGNKPDSLRTGTEDGPTKPRDSQVPTYTGGPSVTYKDKGGASRFFHVFKYQAKAPKKERPVIERADGTKIQHPTVKPLALMEWLVTLITPPGGVVLDPFAGSGTTLQAARDKGFHAIGVEADADHCELIVARLSKDDGGLFAA